MRLLATSPAFGAVSQDVARYLRATLDVDACIVALLDENDLVIVAEENTGHVSLAIGDRLPILPPVEDAIWLPDVPIEMPMTRGGTPSTIRGFASIPLLGEHRESLGRIEIWRAAPLEFDRQMAFNLLEMVARLLCTILVLEQRAFAANLRLADAEREALTDPLTGLWNRRGWDRLLDGAKQTGESPRNGIIALDLDGLKRVNDERGHAAGDALLHLTAETLRAAVRAGDEVARLGGDEFAILIPSANEGMLGAIVERLQNALRQAGGISASLGFACQSGDEPLSVVFAAADERLRMQKRLMDN